MTVIDLRRYRVLIVVIASIIILVFLALGIMQMMKIFYPLEYKDLIEKYAKEYELDPLLITSIIWVESKYDNRAVSSKGAKGLMQIASITGTWAAEELEIDNYNEDLLYNPKVNIRIGCWYLDKLRKEFDGNISLILAAYNGGSGNVNKWLNDLRYSDDGYNLKKIPFRETELYLEKVNSSYKIYKFLYKNRINMNLLYLVIE